MGGSLQRVQKAFAFQPPDRTPLFEIFQPYHPIHWPICGRNIATDAALAWDALAEGVTSEELVEAHAQAEFKVCKHFGLDMVRLNGVVPASLPAGAEAGTTPKKLGPQRWELDGIEHGVNPRTQMVEPVNPGQSAADSAKTDENALRKEILEWDGNAHVKMGPDRFLNRVQELAAAEGLDWVFMGEIGCGTGVAFYPPCMLMWLVDEPELIRRWIEMKKARAFAITKNCIANGCKVVAMGGDVSCDKGPFISPAMYREFILPAIQEHVKVIHDAGALAVYTSDGNHWPIKEDFFFNSGVDGYKEVDQAAGMTWPRLIKEGVYGRVCIIGNLDARHTLCHRTPDDVRREVIECLKYGQTGSGGHILHASHSVHEDVKAENYIAAVGAYREYFGMGRI